MFSGKLPPLFFSYFAGMTTEAVHNDEVDLYRGNNLFSASEAGHNDNDEVDLVRGMASFPLPRTAGTMRSILCAEIRFRGRSCAWNGLFSASEAGWNDEVDLLLGNPLRRLACWQQRRLVCSLFCLSLGSSRSAAAAPASLFIIACPHRAE